MSEPALVLNGISKRLPSGPSRRRLSSTVRRFAHVAGLSSDAASNTGRTIVDNVHLTVRSGEIAVLVGPPGCGKTSLLRIAAGVLRPTAGGVRVAGGSDSLIDPRYGWHSTLTGRENLVLRGVSTGLSVSESRLRAERLADFVEISDWLDRPVQDYPDATLTRLAFGALAFLGARVLVWDDVLEKRDPLFRQKCLALIPTLLREGKAVLMATHDVGKAKEISPRAIWMEEGRVRADGATHSVLERYLEPRVTVAALDPSWAPAAVSRLASIELLDKEGRAATCYFPGDPIRVAIELELTQRVDLPYFLVSIAGAFGPIVAASMFHDGCRPPFIDGRYRIECTFEKIVLAPKQRFTVRFAVYAADGVTVVHPKQVIASFVTGGSAASCGFFHTLAEGRILGGPPMLTDYNWTMPGGIERAWTLKTMACEHATPTAVEENRR